MRRYGKICAGVAGATSGQIHTIWPDMYRYVQILLDMARYASIWPDGQICKDMARYAQI